MVKKGIAHHGTYSGMAKLRRDSMHGPESGMAKKGIAHHGTDSGMAKLRRG